VAEHEIAEALALEDATAIWWPASRLSAWAEAIAAEHRRRCETLLSAGFYAATSRRMSEEAMLSRAARLLVLRSFRAILAPGSPGRDCRGSCRRRICRAA
jgi:hypothetical protein